eukprot:CAMPEP_0113594098 /NCGR_PEP_ID=MMETSP0015_2-20120614/38866_1 /TAXON_ID=2838 /ORGANISM="Odontella" /LENGTH=582 /DNA_ID=CAMNT_0000501013 /DNA_START=159 /DNA_END=1905 /DNA_ORIENTATION=- /assembly_acc=CAM_ASM_000160
MRRSGSSSCMLRPRATLSEVELSSAPPSITMVNTRRLPLYSAERYYVLSELEMHSNSVRFLCDYDDDGAYAESMGAADRGGRPPRNVVLYLLWKPGGGGGGHGDSARAFVEGPIVDALRRLISLRGGDTSALDRDDANGVAPPPPQVMRHSCSGDSGSFGGDSGFGWPSASPATSPLSPPKKPLRSALRVSSVENIAVLPTLEEPVGGGSSSSLNVSMAPPLTSDGIVEKAGKPCDEENVDAKDVPPNGTTSPPLGIRNDDDDSQRRKPPPLPRAAPPLPPAAASVAFSDGPAFPSPNAVDHLPAAGRGREGSDEDEDFIAVDRLSDPAPKYDVDGNAAGAKSTRGMAVNDRGEMHVPESAKSKGIEGNQSSDSGADDEIGVDSETDPSRLRHHRVEVALAESLAKHVASSRRLRSIVDGICVGVASSEVRSATTPALEAALGAVTHGAPERRRGARYLRLPWVRFRRAAGRSGGGGVDESKGAGDEWGDHGLGDDLDAGGEGVDPAKSAVGLAASHPDDLVGIDPQSEPDASQGVLQSITVAEWGGNGDASCFAKRAMAYWRERHGLPGPEEEDDKENGGK